MPSIESNVYIETTKRTVLLSKKEIKEIEYKKNKKMKKRINDILKSKTNTNCGENIENN